MFRISIPWSDGYLLLTPQLGSLPRVLQAIILTAILGLLLFLIARLYRYEIQSVPRRYARLLLGLRMLIVGGIFAAACLTPSVRHVTREDIPSHVLIAIDRSDSMAITDPQRDPIEKLELARGLKLALDLADDKTMTGWIERLRKADVPDEPNYRHIVERMDALSRRGIAVRVLAPEGVTLLKTLAERHRIEIVGFDERLGPLPANFESLRTVLLGEGQNGANAGTDLNLPLKHGLELRDALHEGLIGIVILSDGQHNWGGAPGELAYQLGHTGQKPNVPVYPIVCGARLPPSDLAITSLKATPSIVFKQGMASLDVRLLANNVPAGKIKITIAYPAAPELPARQPIVEFVDYDGVTPPLPRTIPVKMDRAATEKLTVTVEAIARDGRGFPDRFPDNNTRSVVVRVAPDRARVLIVDGESRWEHYYLRTALSRDASMDVKSVVFEQPRLNLVQDATASALKLPDLQWPGPEEMPRFDCIVLGDVSPAQLPIEERVRLEKFVADRGGTLVVLAGKRSMPLEFPDVDDPLARLLPITDRRILEKRGGFRVALTDDGFQTGFMRLEIDPAVSVDRWENLPDPYWAIVGKPKEGAIVLAQARWPNEKVGAEQGDALIVRQNYGFGHVVYVGLDSTWRWRFKQGDKFHHRFWSQLIRWAASDRGFTASNDHVRFGIREPVYRGDQDVEMLVRLGPKAPKLDREALVGARFYRKIGHAEEAIALAQLKANPEIPGQYEGKQANLPPGDYEMELAMPDIDSKLNGPDGKKLRAPFQVLPSESGEMLNLATNWERLKEIADKSGGLIFPADQAAALIEKLKSRTASREFTTDKHLEQSWWLLLPLLLLLSAEWLLRKWVGLA